MLVVRASSAGAAMNEHAVETDREVLDFESLKARCLGNLDLVERVLNKFTSQLDADLERLEQALLAHDTSAFASVAHRIKGMSANVEARCLHSRAVVAEECARHNHEEGLMDHLERMRDERSRLAESFAKFKPQVKS
jgi:HPt (histidine-containing phosphotransfer) domain-containing protein